MNTPEISTLFDLMKRIESSKARPTLHHNLINISVISHA